MLDCVIAYRFCVLWPVLIRARHPQETMEQWGMTLEVAPERIEVAGSTGELARPYIQGVGRQDNILTAANYCRREAFSQDTGFPLCHWPAGADRVKYYVRVTFDSRDEKMAREWADRISRALDDANAPVQFFKIEYAPLREHTHADIVEQAIVVGCGSQPASRP